MNFVRVTTLSLFVMAASKDFTQAVTLYRKAANGGLADAQAALAVMYMDGRGVAKDDNLAVQMVARRSIPDTAAVASVID